MNETDLELLVRYREHQDEDAFAEILRRHLNLVYSAALRQVRSPQLAEEVAQSVFTDLARNALRLAPDTILPAWLYKVTHRTALNVARREARRHLREQVASEMNAMNATDANWTQVAPLLDEAMHALDETDRTAVLLRFFENKSLREVGQALGTSDDTAQKRVSRALDRLRDFLVKRGVTVGATGLAAVISANAVQAAPVGLGAAITAAVALANSTIASTATLALSQTIAMTTLQKVLIAAVLVAAGAGTPWLIQHQSQEQLRAENESLRGQNFKAAQLAAENERLSNLVVQLKTPPSRQARTPQPLPRIPAPAMRGGIPTPDLSEEEAQSGRRVFEIVQEDQPRRLNAEQVKPYLEQNRRSAASLLAAFRATGDAALLQEALQKYPNDPEVTFAGVFKKDAPPEEKRQRLDAFKQSAPDNALANYLSALDYFKSGQVDAAIQELGAASAKPQFQDYALNFVQENDDAWSSAGYSTAEAKAIASISLELPYLGQLKELAQNTVSLANSYRQAGDEASAQLVLQMGANLGQRFGGIPGEPLISQMVAMAVENIDLHAMDPSGAYAGAGGTVQDRMNELVQQRSAIRDLITQFTAVQPTMSAQDWISYIDRCRIFGEQAAEQWAVNKHAQK